MVPGLQTFVSSMIDETVGSVLYLTSDCHPLSKPSTLTNPPVVYGTELHHITVVSMNAHAVVARHGGRIF